MALTEADIYHVFEAILNDDIGIIKRAIKRGFTALAKSPTTSDMALHFACLNSKLTVLDLLKPTMKDGEVDTINIDEEDDSICGTALHISMDGQVDPEVVKKLLQFGANPNALDAKGCPVIHELIYRAWEEFQADFEDNSSDNINESIKEQCTFDAHMIKLDRLNTGAVNAGGLIWMEYSDPCNESTEVQNDETMEKLNGSSCIAHTSKNVQTNRCTDTLYQRVDDDIGEDNEETSCGRVNKIFEFDAPRILEKVRLLCDFGANMNIVHAQTKITPLHFWFQNFNWMMAECNIKQSIPEWCTVFLNTLLNCGASINSVASRNQTTPLVYLTQRHYKPDFASYMDSLRHFSGEVFNKFKLFKHQDIHGRVLLHQAVEHCNIVVVQELVKFYEDVNMRDRFGLAPLHLCTHTLTSDEAPFVIEMIEALVKHGADVNVQDDFGATPLHHAVNFNNHAAIECLLRNGASLSIEDTHSRTTKDVAEIQGDAATLRLIGLESTLNQSGPIVSDTRHGLIFQLCCHKECSLNSRGFEEPEHVAGNFIDKWLVQFPMCWHNRKLVLENSISRLQFNMSQIVLIDEDSRTMRKEIFEFALRLAKSIKMQNPLFESHVVFGGSVAEETKVGSCDEFDIVFDLVRIREIVEMSDVEDETLKGFVHLKANHVEEFKNYSVKHLLDENGFLKRSDVSNQFHKYIQNALNDATTWQGTRFFGFWGNTNLQGECFNIGQLQLVWYGSYLKREDVSVDIAPIIRFRDWIPKNWISKNNLVNESTAKSIGCFLMMKDVKRNIDENDEIVSRNRENLLFKVSISQVEHATMKFAPRCATNGYKIAKSIQLLCPHLLFNFEQTLKLSTERVRTCEHDNTTDTFLALFEASEFVTSYVLKTGLFYELESRGFVTEFSANDSEPIKWNNMILSGDVFERTMPSKDEIQESVLWALSIYKKIQALVVERKHVPEFFLAQMEATKVPGNSDEFVLVMSGFLKCVIYFLENFEIPDDVLK
ncbi:uncharacterized protein LOC127867504 [Dreissena polymorpha]|uniref:Mab-21-like nucleotidyltransferase domain-containing protein n=1 Tax=Dreissena polymorpha TaxID=45954 RepID=A0A9D4M173_DREPO|nr:uncharacterized protein LOC127867504 [Dreissena polymorpha]KAH3867357.1 hypothetical protein DPMN_030484 [Dreissena polymorpha]